MKPTVLLLALTGSLWAAPPAIPPEALAEIKRTSPMAQLTQPEADDSHANTPPPAAPSLLNESVILTDGTHWAIVPKGAVLHTPKSLQTRISTKPVGSLLSWGDFLNKNRSWLTTQEVNFDQAKGEAPLDAQQVEFWQTRQNIVVAVHQGGPISVKPASTTSQTPDSPTP
ncbi:MAG: hypothetical protein QM627_00380 [Luteolibacter sp.]